MKSGIKSVLLTVLLVFCFSAAATAMEKGNDRKGKYAYRKIYKSCQARGAVGSSVPSISPADKTQAQWNQVFDNKKFDEFGCKEEWSKLSDKEVIDIYTYLHSFAADSPTPAKCQ
ncbi:MAG: cytochrome c family protein [Thermodesulfobacteriota bacterium]